MNLISGQRYHTAAITLHWAIATLILVNLITGSFMEDLHAPAKHIVVSLHASTGLTVLLLSLVRLWVRLTHRPPPFDSSLSPLERRAAEAAHILLYFLMIAMPILGWAITSASTRKASSSFYFLMPTPKLWFLEQLPDPDKIRLHDQFVTGHAVGAWILLALLFAHVGGALKHQFIDRHPQFARMWFSTNRK